MLLQDEKQSELDLANYVFNFGDFSSPKEIHSNVVCTIPTFASFEPYLRYVLHFFSNFRKILLLQNYEEYFFSEMISFPGVLRCTLLDLESNILLDSKITVNYS